MTELKNFDSLDPFFEENVNGYLRNSTSVE